MSSVGKTCPYNCGMTISVNQLHTAQATEKNLSQAMSKHYMQYHFQGYTCSQCGAVFKRKAQLGEHAELHEWRIKYLAARKSGNSQEKQNLLFDLDELMTKPREVDH